MGVYVLRQFTATGGGNLAGRILATLYGDAVIPPEDPTRDGTSHGSASVWGLFDLAWTMVAEVTAYTPGTTTYGVGGRVTVTGPSGGPVADDDLATYVVTAKTEADESRSGSWTVEAEVELCVEIVKPTPPSGTGAGSYNPDPPTGTTHRLFLRTVNGGAWSIEATFGGATATSSGTFGAATELSYPDGFDLAVHAEAATESSGSGFTINASTTGGWRGGTIGTDITASSSHGSASATAAGGCVVAATVATGDDAAEADASMSVAVPAEWSLDAQLRAMEVAYPDSVNATFTRAGTSATVTFTSSYSYSTTYRAESSAVQVVGGSTVEDSDSYSHPSNFGAIALAVTTASLTALLEPVADTAFWLKDRRMNALAIEVPADSGDLAGSDTALAGSPWGVKRDWTGGTPAWVGMMGWRYLAVAISESGGAGAGNTVTIAIGARVWSQDAAGAAMTTPGSGNTATYTIDLTAPDSAANDPTDTTYPYDADWSDVGGDEDDRYRTGEGAMTGPLRAETLEVRSAGATTLTLTSVKGTRTVASTVYCTNLPPFAAWLQQRPTTVVSESGTTTEHFVRQTFMVDLEGRLLAAEWSDTEWDRTTGGVSGVVTHSVYERSVEWLADRINAAVLCPGWSATISAPAVGATGTVEEYYNRERELHGLLGGGYWWEAPSGGYPSGRWVSGIDAEMRTSGGGALVLPWQGGFTSLLALPGNIGDPYLHGAAGTSGPTILKAAKTLRCQGVGQALTMGLLPDASATLELTQDAASRGTGATDALGYAQTGTTFGRGGGGTVLLELAGESSLYPPRGRKRLHFRAIPTDETPAGPSIDTDERGRTVVGYVMGGTAWLAFMEDQYGATYATADSGIAATEAVVRWQLADADCRVLLVYVTGGGAIECVRTDDEGGAFSVATTIISAGTHPAVAGYPSGWLLFAWYDGGAIKGRWFDADLSLLRDTFTILASGAADDCLGLTYDPVSELWYLVYQTTGGAIATLYSVDGYTFL